MNVNSQNVTPEDLRDVVQVAKDDGKRVLALAPSKIVKGKVTEYVLLTQ